MAEIKETSEYWDRMLNHTNSPSTPLSFNMEILAEQCIKGEYVLVLGSAVMLDRSTPPGCSFNGNSELMLLNGTKKYQNVSLPFGICQFLNEVNNDGFLTCDSLNPELKRLLCHRCFRTIVTTAYDPFLEIYLNELLKNQYKILNINADGKNGIKRDISSSDIQPNEFNQTTPILYYAFGKAEYENLASNTTIKEFATTDNEKMKIVAQWLSDQAPKNFLKHLRHKRILAIGCKFDDWLFRFFWYMLQKDINHLDKGEVVFDYSEESDIRLKEYLQSQRIEVFENAQEFMGNLAIAIKEVKEKAITNLKSGNNDMLQAFGDKGIFISYAHEDFWIVNTLYKKLDEKGFNVWMDVRLEASDKYDQRIESAIKQCKIFIPILSSTVKQTLESGECKNRYFYNKEWKIVEDCIMTKDNIGENNIVVLPILVDSFDIGKSYKNRLKPFIKSIHSYDIGKQKLDVLINKLKELLKNESDE